MAKMKAIQVSKANAPFELVERDIPEPAPGWVRIKVEACGMCHSDAFARAAAFPGITLPRIPAHEVAGRIDAVATNVTQWKASDRAGVAWHGGRCLRCNARPRGLWLNGAKPNFPGSTHDGGSAQDAA